MSSVDPLPTLAVGAGSDRINARALDGQIAQIVNRVNTLVAAFNAVFLDQNPVANSVRLHMFSTAAKQILADTITLTAQTRAQLAINHAAEFDLPDGPGYSQQMDNSTGPAPYDFGFSTGDPYLRTITLPGDPAQQYWFRFRFRALGRKQFFHLEGTSDVPWTAASLPAFINFDSTNGVAYSNALTIATCDRLGVETAAEKATVQVTSAIGGYTRTWLLNAALLPASPFTVEPFNAAQVARSSDVALGFVAYGGDTVTLTNAGSTVAAAEPESYAPTVTASGNYAGQQTIVMSSTTGCTIRYTTDGTDPSDTVGTIYSGPITLSTFCGVGQTKTVKAVAYGCGYVVCPPVTRVYTGTAAATPLATPSGSYDGAKLITLSGWTEGSTPQYSTDTITWLPYTVPFRLDGYATTVFDTASLYTRAVDVGYGNSATSSQYLYLRTMTVLFPQLAGQTLIGSSTDLGTYVVTAAPTGFPNTILGDTLSGDGNNFMSFSADDIAPWFISFRIGTIAPFNYSDWALFDSGSDPRPWSWINGQPAGTFTVPHTGFSSSRAPNIYSLNGNLVPPSPLTVTFAILPDIP